jgi:hypothetical protein
MYRYIPSSSSMVVKAPAENQRQGFSYERYQAIKEVITKYEGSPGKFTNDHELLPIYNELDFYQKKLRGLFLKILSVHEIIALIRNENQSAERQREMIKAINDFNNGDFGPDFIKAWKGTIPSSSMLLENQENYLKQFQDAFKRIEEIMTRMGKIIS